jgi:hypothetical protein
MPFDTEVDEGLMVLQRARDRIARGWCRGDLSHNGGYCLIGAIMADKLKDAPDDGVYAASEPYVKLLGFPDQRAAWSWNDSWVRTKAEVLARLDRGIALRAAGKEWSD